MSNNSSSSNPPPYGYAYPPQQGQQGQYYPPPAEEYYPPQHHHRDEYYPSQPPPPPSQQQQHRDEYYPPPQAYYPPPQQYYQPQPAYYAPPQQQNQSGSSRMPFYPPQQMPPQYAPHQQMPHHPYAHMPMNRSRSSRSRSPKRQQHPPAASLMKPGDIAFSIIIPVMGDLHQHGERLQREFGDDLGIYILLSAPEQLQMGPSGPRRVAKFIGKWSPCLAAQRRVLDTFQRPSSHHANNQDSTSITILDCEQLVLLSKDDANRLTAKVVDEIQLATQTQIKTYSTQGDSVKAVLLSVFCASSPFPSFSDPNNPSAPPPDDVIVLKTNRVSNALRLIKQALSLDSFLSDEPSLGSTEPISRMVIPIPSRFAGSVIGKNAQIVRDMEHTTKARINLSREGTRVVNQASGETFRFVTAEGTAEQVVHASKLVNAYLKEAKEKFDREGGASGGGGGGGGNAMLRTLKVPLSVPDHLIGVIIGKGGKSLKQLQEDFHCKVVIEHNEDSHQQKTSKMNRLVEIVGDLQRVEECQKYIVEKLIEAASVEPPPSMPQRKRSRERGGRRNNSPPPAPAPTAPRVVGEPFAGEGQEKMIVTVPISQVGAVIGNKGSTVRQICEESGGRVHIESKDDIAPDATERKVTITGHPHQVVKALSLVQRALYESNEARKQSGGVSSIPSSNMARGADLVTVLSSTVPYPNMPAQYPSASQPLPPLPPQHNYYPPMPPAYGALPSPFPSSASSSASSSTLFDPDKLSILASQLTRNFPPVGSGNITQITGSPPNNNPGNNSRRY